MFNASYYRQLSLDIEIINYENKRSFVRPEKPKAQANKTGINFMLFILTFVDNCLLYDAIHDLSVRHYGLMNVV